MGQAQPAAGYAPCRLRRGKGAPSRSRLQAEPCTPAPVSCGAAAIREASVACARDSLRGFHNDGWYGSRVHRIAVAVCFFFGLAVVHCDRKPDASSHPSAKEPGLRPTGSSAEQSERPAPSAESAPPIDWTKARAFRPLASHLPAGMDLCSTVLRYDIPQDKFLLRDGTQDLVRRRASPGFNTGSRLPIRFVSYSALGRRSTG